MLKRSKGAAGAEAETGAAAKAGAHPGQGRRRTAPGRRGAGGSWMAAMMFNLALLALAVTGARTLKEATQIEPYGFPVTQTTLRDTRTAVDAALRGLLPPGQDPRAAWSRMVAADLAEEDLESARGLLLGAPQLLAPEDARRIAAKTAELVTLDPQLSQDEAQIAAAAGLLAPETAARWTELSSPAAQVWRAAAEFGEGAVTGQADTGAGLAGAITSDFFVVGDVRDLIIQSGNWVRDEPVDVFILTLSGIGLGLTAASVASSGGAAPLKAGASVVKSAKRAGALTARMAKRLETLVAEAVPPARLRAELSAAMATPAILPGQRAARIGDAFKRAQDPAGMARLADEFGEIKAIANRTSPAAAVRLMRNVETAEDLKKTRLVAEAGGPRSVALAKRLDRLAFLGLAKGLVKVSYKFGRELAGVAVSAFLFLAAAAAALAAEGAASGRRRRAARVAAAG
jgi:hypothetical protein